MIDEVAEIREYFDMKDSFAKENQLWAKYYNIDFYLGGVGLAGEGAEALGEGNFGQGKSFGGGGGRRASFGGGVVGNDDMAGFPIESDGNRGGGGPFTDIEVCESRHLAIA